MTWEISFDVPGAPVGKQRPRQGWTGGAHPRRVFYTPKKTQDYERRVRARFGAAHLQEACRLGSKATVSGLEAKRITVWCYFKNGHHPDPDNVLKLVIDALKGAAYQKDDRNLASAVIPAHASADPRIEVTVEG